MAKKNGAKTKVAKKPTAAQRDALAERIGKNIADRRAQIDMTQEVLAKALDVTPLYVSAMENGRRSPSLPLFIGLARALGTTLDKLAAEVG